MGFVIAVVSVLSSVVFLYYMGKSGFKWGDSNEEE